jgi:hypothetical protein
MALLNCCMEGVSAVPPSGRLSGAKGPSAGEFAYVKTKELLACLIDRRGALRSAQEMIANLLERI